MSIFTTPSLYIESATCIKDRIAKYDLLINALTDTAIKGAENQDIEEYQLDDGQTRIRNTFRDPNQIFKAIQNYQKLRQLDINRLNGSNSIRLIDFNSNSNC